MKTGTNGLQRIRSELQCPEHEVGRGMEEEEAVQVNMDIQVTL
jgi:hypothetical protein